MGLTVRHHKVFYYISKKNEADSQKIAKQTELEVKLANIEKELVRS